MHRSRHQAVMALLLLWPPFSGVVADELPASDGAEPPSEAIEADGYDAEAVDEDDDDTADYDVDTSVDVTDARKGVLVDGDLRAIVDYFDRDTRDGASVSDERLGARVRLGANFGITDSVYVGARLAGTCFTDDCDPEFVLDSNTPTNSGLEGGQFTFDELYLQWFRTERGAFAFGRLQTRFVLRGGVYAK